MAGSALKELANATATFTVPTAGTTTDAATGNIIPNTATVTVTFYLRQGGTSNQDLQGVQVEGDAFDGYAIEPQILDARVKSGVTGTLSFAGDAAAPCIVSRARFPYGSTGLLGATLQSTLGDRISIIRYRQA
jgi:hypothetical protein